MNPDSDLAKWATLVGVAAGLTYLAADGTADPSRTRKAAQFVSAGSTFLWLCVSFAGGRGGRE